MGWSKAMTVRKARKLRDLLLIAGLVIMYLGYIFKPFYVIGTLVALSALIPHILWNRCPCCGRLLGRAFGDYCQFCGKSIDE